MTRIAARFVLPLLVVATIGCGRPAQIGPDRDTFRAVDALYTAVGMRDLKLIDRCQAELEALQAQGKIPDAAASTLAAYIVEAKSGGWEPAQTKLATFMEGQRR